MSRTWVIVTRLIVLAALAGLPGLGEATPPRGGSGGSGFTLDCGSDSVLAGVVTRSGVVIDSVEAVCVKVKGDGTWSGGYQSKGRAGGNGGAPASLYCDENWAVTGIHGRSGNLVDKLGVRCGKLGVQGGAVKVVSGDTMRGAMGGNGGAPFDDVCPGGQMGRGLRGRSGALLDQIELTCHTPSVQAAPAQLAQKAAGRPRMSTALAGPGKLEIEVPCGAPAVQMPLRRPNDASAGTALVPTLTVNWAERVEVPICVTPGWAKYEWRRTTSWDSTFRDADKPRAILSFTPRPGSPSGGFWLQDGKWQAVFGAQVTVDAPVALQGSDRPYGIAIFNIVVNNMPVPPNVTKVWIEDYRPNRPGPLENFGIVDPALVGNPEPIDGEFFVEGTGLANRRVLVGNKEAIVLSHTTAGSVERVKAKVRDFAPARVVVEAPGGARSQSSQPLKRLGWWVMANDVLPTFLRDLSVVIGSPRGQGSVTLLGSTRPMSIAGYRQGGVSIDVTDMRSEAPTIVTRQVGDELEYTITVPFETAGKELDGTFLGTVEYWTCGGFEVPKSSCGNTDIGCFLNAIGNSLRGSASCMNPNNWSSASRPGPSVPLSGDLTSPKATLVAKIGIGGGRLVHRSTTVNFTADISLSASGISLPVQLIQTQILTEVNRKLGDAVKPNDLGTQLAERLQQLFETLNPQGKLEHVVVVQDGSVFFGFHRP